MREIGFEITPSFAPITSETAYTQMTESDISYATTAISLVTIHGVHTDSFRDEGSSFPRWLACSLKIVPVTAVPNVIFQNLGRDQEIELCHIWTETYNYTPLHLKIYPNL